MSAGTLTITKSGPSILLEGELRDLLLEPIGSNGREEYAVLDIHTNECLAVAYSRPEAYQMAVALCGREEG